MVLRHPCSPSMAQEPWIVPHCPHSQPGSRTAALGAAKCPRFVTVALSQPPWEQGNPSLSLHSGKGEERRPAGRAFYGEVMRAGLGELENTEPFA